MDLKGLSPKGIELYNANPDKTPIQLAALGLSEADFNILSAQTPKKRGAQPKPKFAEPETEQPTKVEVEQPKQELPEVVQPIKVEITKPTSLRRDNNTHTTPSTISKKKVACTYRNKKTGRVQQMNRATMEMMVRNNPDTYEILD